MAEEFLVLVEHGERAISDKEIMDAYSLLAKGKRNLVCGEISKAVNQLQEACRTLAEKFGETADECGEAYFCYGKALLDLSRMESGVLGNALEGIEEDKSEESDEKTSSTDDVIEADETTEAEKQKISDEVLDAMLETDDEVKARIDQEKTEDGKNEGKEAGQNGVKTDEKDAEMKDASEKEKVEEKDTNDEEKAAEKEKSTEDKEKSTEDKEKSTEDKEKSTEDEEKSPKDEDKDTKESEEQKEKPTKEDSEEAMETGDAKEGETSQEEGETGAESEDIADEEEGDEGEEDVDEGEAGEGGEGGEETEKEKKEGEEGEGAEKKEEDVSNLQLAWEMLELSKIIYKRHSDKKENQLKLADTFLKLGEVGLETEQYETSIADFKECLKLQKEVLEAQDRALAETYYQLGLACCFSTQYDDSVQYYRDAASSIEKKIVNVKKVVEEGEKESKGKEQANPEDPLIKAQKELKDLQEILPDIMAKIEDVLDEKRSADKVKAMVKENVAADLGQTSTGFGQTTTKSGDSAATDITHLVRKKRKPDDDVDDKTKKAKTENGSGDTEPTAMNGTSDAGSKILNGEAKEVEAAS